MSPVAVELAAIFVSLQLLVLPVLGNPIYLLVRLDGSSSSQQQVKQQQQQLPANFGHRNALGI